MARNVASVEIQARSTGLRAQLREARAAFGNFADNVGTLMRRGMAKAYGSAFGAKKKGGKEGFLRGAGKSAVGNMAADATSRVAGFVSDVGRSTLDFEDKLARLQIQANETPEVMRAFADSVTRASDATGIGRDKILDGANAYVTLTGEMDTARSSAGTFAKIAQATGSSVGDIAKAAAAASQNLGISAGDFESMFDIFTGQGKAGAIELKDMASELSTIAPQWAQFAGGKGLQGARQLGAAMQIVKKGFGGEAAETVTGIQSFLTAVQKKSGRFTGANFFDVGKDGKRSLKDVFTIVDEIGKSKVAKDPRLLTKAFGSVEAYRAYIQLRDNRAELDKMANAAQFAGTIQRDFDTYTQSSAGRMAKAWEGMRNSIAATFTPERITAFANAVEDLAGKVGVLADGFGKVFGFLGTLNSVGRSVRGFFTGNENSNPWGANPLDTMRDQQTATGDGGWIRTPDGRAVRRDSAEGRGHVKAAQLRLKHREGWNQSVGDIMGGEVNERTSPESIKRAAMASFSGNAGSSLAGDRYLKNAGVSKEQVDEIVRKEMQGLGVAFLGQLGIGNTDVTRQLLIELQKISANTAAGTEVKVGADAVAKASKDAPKHRRGVAR